MKRPYIFIPCIVDQLSPETGFAALKILRSLGCAPYYTPDQTCCGQPAFNAGYHFDARLVAERFLEVFRDAEEIISLSGSCATMIKVFYPQMDFHAGIKHRVKNTADRIYEITQYIVRVLGVTDLGLTYNGCVLYHDSCHIMRELRITEEPRALLRSVRGLELIEPDRADRCCGFGGLFSAKFPEISTAMGEEKLASIERAGADIVVGCDTSCLMQLQGVAQKQGKNIRMKHIIEFLGDLMP